MEGEERVTRGRGRENGGGRGEFYVWRKKRRGDKRGIATRKKIRGSQREEERGRG